MVNESTLRFLNNNAFGADIDSLESYVIDFKQSSLISDLSKYESTYMKLYEVLKNLKRNSVAFNESTSLQVIENDRFDKLFKIHSSKIPVIAYGKDDSNINTFKDQLDLCSDAMSDIVCLTYSSGINIKVTYDYGYINAIYAVGNHCKYIDLTDKFKNKIPSYMKEFKDYKLVELRGKVVLGTDKLKNITFKYPNVPCYINRLIRLDINIDILELIFDNIYIDIETINLPFNNQWEMLDYIEDCGFKTETHVLIRSISKEILSQALIEIGNYFENEALEYDCSGIEIRMNDNTMESSKFIYKDKECDIDKEFTAVVKSISNIHDEDGIKHRINIVNTQCNDKLAIDYIDIDDIYLLEEKKISTEKKIKFHVIESKAVII